MQNPHLKLKEIIWEMTGECRNNCSFCGSKEVSGVKTSDKKIIKIAKKIAKFPPEEIDISGGDPLLVSKKTHKEVLKILQGAGVKCKIVVNSRSLIDGKMKVEKKKLRIVNSYDHAGVSINEGVDAANADLSLLGKIKNKTIITNFNLQNLKHYKEIEKVVKNHDCIWMVFFTMYKGDMDDLVLDNNAGDALYNYNEEERNELFGKIKNSINNGVKVALADNINNGKCSAGLASLGILCDGTVVPCLSMRAWVENIGHHFESNVFSSSLQDIWFKCFKEQRFGKFRCCKDHCNNVYFDEEQRTTIEEIEFDFPAVFPKKIKPETIKEATNFAEKLKKISKGEKE